MSYVSNKNTENDPFAGFASCPDKTRNYLENSIENQIIWKQKSEETIREFIANLPSFKIFREAYAFLADKRHSIAVELKQRPNDYKKRIDLYGVFRQEEDHYRQSVTAGDGEQYWKWQKKKIFELTYKLIEPVKSIRIFQTQPGYLYENHFMTCLKEKVVVDDKYATYYCISIKFPNDERPNESLSYSHKLSQIELFDFEINKRFNLIRVEYTPIDSDKMEGNYFIANKYFQAMLNWKKEEGMEKFMIYAAKFAYFTAHYLIVKHGNSSMIEWMLRAIAFRNGIYLGRFNFSDGISWDFKALLTPDINEYIKWFCEQLFIDTALLPAASVTSEFTFEQSK